jgi:Leucine-rich repeat (LRR) protein
LRSSPKEDAFFFFSSFFSGLCMDFSDQNLSSAELTRCLEAESLQNDSLDASNNALDVLPENVKSFKELEFVDFSKNKLTSAVVLSELTNLTYVHLHSNQLKLNFDFVRKCTNLTHLNLCDNCLTEISPFLTNLKHLEYLNLAKNFIDLIPEELFSLKELNVLNISGNSLSGALDDRMANLESLTSLELFENRLSSFGDLSKLLNLQILRLDSNCLQKLGEFPPNLAVLNLSNNSDLEEHLQFKSSKKNDIQMFLKSK